MNSIQQRSHFFDTECTEMEQLPRRFSVTFKEVGDETKRAVQVLLNDTHQIGDVINDNAYQNDFYRYHDIFHYTFAAMLGWSPCARAMMKCKRKSSPLLDEIEDGARATITEEAISLLIFNEAKRNNLFKNALKISKQTLKTIKEMTDNFEVKSRSRQEWQRAILKAYDMFRFLSENGGGKVVFDAYTRQVDYVPL
jgi:hypothetical protein